MSISSRIGFAAAATYAVAILLNVSATLLPRVANAGISVTLYFVDIASEPVDSQFYACKNAALAGPFMSGSSAIDWRNRVLKNENAKIVVHSSTEPDVCKGPPLFYDSSKGWYRG
jgi:hypothetical protein